MKCNNDDDNDHRWLPEPILAMDFNGNMIYDWNLVEVKPEFGKGNGLFHKVDNKCNLCIIYGGVKVDDQYRQNIEDNFDSEFSSYIVNGRQNRNRRVVSYLDAHPRLYPNNIPRYAWIGCFSNMPSAGEEINAILRVLPVSDKSTPNYPHVIKDPVVYIQTLVDGKAGEPILIDYGWNEETKNLLLPRPIDITDEMVTRDEMTDGMSSLITATEIIHVHDVKVKDYSHAHRVWKQNALNATAIKKKKQNDRRKHWQQYRKN